MKMAKRHIMIISHNSRVVLESRDLKEPSTTQDAVDCVVKLAKWSKKEKGFRREGDYVIDCGYGPDLLIQAIGDCITFCEINHSEHVYSENNWEIPDGD